MQDKLFMLICVIVLCGGYFFNDLREMLAKLTRGEDQADPGGYEAQREMASEAVAVAALRGTTGGAAAPAQEEYLETSIETPKPYTGKTDYKESPEISSLRPKFKKLRKLRQIVGAHSKSYCVPIEGDPDKGVVGTFSVRGFCQRRPTFYELCLASGTYSYSKMPDSTLVTRVAL